MAAGRQRGRIAGGRQPERAEPAPNLGGLHGSLHGSRHSSAFAIVVLCGALVLAVASAPGAAGALRHAKHGQASRGPSSPRLARAARHGGKPRHDAVASPPSCPWVLASARHSARPEALAREVLARLTLPEKLGFIVLDRRDGVENINTGIARLCIPPLTLSDGPNGISAKTPGATQLPAALGLAATFDPKLAARYGAVLADEARRKGIDVIQAPELNLARVPFSGRIFEAFGEDPLLASVMGVAEVRAIQARKVIADIKHFTAYNQETARRRLNEVVLPRALAEIYNAPFRAAIEQGHAASLMCAYGSLNSINVCSDPRLYRALWAWKFNGFVRSDLRAVRNPVAAFRAGLDLIKPASVAGLERLVERHVLSLGVVNRAVFQTLRVMFAFGLIAHPRPLTPDVNTNTAANLGTARIVAERSMVLLKNRSGILPLPKHLSSLAVIGADATTDPMSAGFGSAYVRSRDVVRPLAALARAFPHAKIRGVIGGPVNDVVPELSPLDILNGHVLAGSSNLEGPTEPGREDLKVVAARKVAPAALTAPSPGRGPGWSHWSVLLRVRQTGRYVLSLVENGDTWCYLDGRKILSMPGLQTRAYWSTTVRLVAQRPYRLSLDWLAVAGERPPRVGLEDVTPAIHAAVEAARASKVAIVFASDWTREGADRPSLLLPGDANALIGAVAAANPNTIVVLNTGGAVLMPWLARVRAVLEAWYPGQVDGAATAAVLTGRVDPSGRLPITFPASARQTPVASSPAAYPGADGTVTYREGLDIGYRWYLANHQKPLFPFGFGLSYTRFSLSDARLVHAAGRVIVHVRAANRGRRAGIDVIEAYLSYPQAAGEPPWQLRAFAAIRLRPGQTRVVRLDLWRSGFEADLNGHFQVVPGLYRIALGSSVAARSMELSTPAP